MSHRHLRLSIPQVLLNRMSELAQQAHPAEVVGLLGGRAGHARSIYPLTNRAVAGRFFADPYEQYLAETQIARAGEQVLATFHSHPEGPAELSLEDIRFVFEVAPIAIVVAAGARVACDMNAYERQADGTVLAVEIVESTLPRTKRR